MAGQTRTHGSTLAAAAAAAFAYILMGIELGGFGPAISEWMRDFRVGPATIGSVFTASSLGSVGATLLYPRAVQRWGLRRVLAVGAARFGAGLALAAAAPGPGWLLAGFGVAGMGFAALDSGVNHLYVL
ncbi:MAG: MFS transporter, partial [Bacillota bacterium]